MRSCWLKCFVNVRIVTCSWWNHRWLVCYLKGKRLSIFLCFFFASCFFRGCICAILLLLHILTKRHLEVFHFRNESVLLKFHKHLLLHGSLILARVKVKLRLQLLISFLLRQSILVKLLFLLLHSPMVDLLEVFLFLQFVISWARLFGNDSRFIQFVL